MNSRKSERVGLSVFFKKSKNSDGQIAIEFLLIIGLSFFVILTFVIVAAIIGVDNNERKAYEELSDYGQYLQKEFFLASEMEDGYVRVLNVPETVNGLVFNITLGNYNNVSYYTINYQAIEFYYQIPQTTGLITKGKNHLKKINDTLYLN